MKDLSHYLIAGACCALLVAGCSKEQKEPEKVERVSVKYEYDKTPLPEDLTWHPSTNWVDTIDPIADPNARKGGMIRFNGSQPPKSLNAYVDNNSYTKMTFDLMYEYLIGVDSQTLEFVPSLAKKWAVSADGRVYVFVIDERAHWSDGVPVTAADVKWTFDTVMDEKYDTGVWKTLLADFESPTLVDEYTIKFVKKGDSGKNWRDILHCGNFWILPKHALEGKDFDKLDLIGVPVGGAYRVARVDEQVETEFARVENWWRRDFPSCKSTCNFDRIIMRYYVDNENAFEALKKHVIDIYPVYTARIMNNETRGDKFYRNWIAKRIVHNHNPPGFQGFAMNMRKKPFNDIRVRKAMAHLVDREMMNRTMMSNAYFLLKSYYTEVYDEEHPCTNEFYDFNVERAKELLAEAGYENGFEFTFLSRSPTEDKFLAPFSEALKKCNISMKIVRKDFAGWMRDMDSFSFEMTWAAYGGSIFKDPQVQWLSSEADREGSGNVTGFKSAKVDELIQYEKGLETTAERNEVYRQIDSLVAAECPFVLLWQADTRRLLYWNKFGMPKPLLGKYSDEDCIFGYWWYDADKAKELKEAMDEDVCLPSLPLHVSFDEEMSK